MPKASMNLIRSILNGLQQLGFDYEELLALAGIDRDWIDDLDRRIDCKLALALINEAQKISNDPDFGLRLGQKIHPATMGIAGYLLLTAPTLKRGLLSYCHYQRIYCEGVLISIQETDSAMRVIIRTYTELSAMFSHHVLSYNVAAVLTMFRMLLGVDVFPIESSLTQASPKDITPYREFFGPTISFHRQENYLQFERHLFERPLLQSNPAIFEIFCRKAEEDLQRVAYSPYHEQVCKTIIQLLDGESPLLKRVAAKLNMSPRTLQRYLRDENTSFQEILDNVRMNVAVSRLTQTALSIDELGYLLGFSEVSAFRKAFKKWTGVTPTDFRKNLPVSNLPHGHQPPLNAGFDSALDLGAYLHDA